MNTETGVSSQCWFWPKIDEQAMKCEHYGGAKPMNCFATNPGVFFGLLHANGVELVLLIDPLTLWQELMFNTVKPSHSTVFVKLFSVLAIQNASTGMTEP